MLAILQIRMRWTKENRTPEGSIRRQKYYMPVMIEPDIPLLGDGIFLKKCNYLQQNNTIQSEAEASENLDRQLYQRSAGQPFAGQHEHEQKMAQYRSQHIRHDKGAFYQPDNLDIPCIRIIEEPAQCYRIRWFDGERGMPRRRGGNEELYLRGTRLSGRPNLLNETAFILKEGESGILRYNYRCTSYHGQWYECYYIYTVNVQELAPDVFIRDYTYTYDQMADLF